MFAEVIEDFDQVESYFSIFFMEWFRHEGLGSPQLTFDLEPSGLQFSTAARLTLPYEADTEAVRELWPALVIGQWSDNEPTGLLQNRSIDSEAHTITADILHFSDQQVLVNAAVSLYRVGAQLVAVETRLAHVAAAIRILPLGLFEGTRTAGVDLSNEQVEALAADTAREMLCAIDPVDVDMSIPEGIKWNELMGSLSNMAPLFTPLQDSPPDFYTYKEDALIAGIGSEPGKVSFGRVFQLSMQLNDNNVFNSLMTMHNLRSSGAHKNYESMSYVHPSIDDLQGAHYHMAGLALLAMFTGSEYQSILFGNIDEQLMSGAAGGDFEMGELAANLVGSLLATALNEFDPATCRGAVGHLQVCNEPFPGQVVTIRGDCARSWTQTTDEDGAVSIGSIPNDCTTLWLEATINGEVITGSHIAVTAKTEVDLGTLTASSVLTQVEGIVVDDEIPPAASEDATVTVSGEQTTTDANGVFVFDEQWLTCGDVVATARKGVDGGTSLPTPVRPGVTNVGIIVISELTGMDKVYPGGGLCYSPTTQHQSTETSLSACIAVVQTQLYADFCAAKPDCTSGVYTNNEGYGRFYYREFWTSILYGSQFGPDVQFTPNE